MQDVTPASRSTAATPPSLPPNASLWTRVKLGWFALNQLKHDAGDPIYGPLLNVCLDSDVYRRLATAWRGSASGLRLLTERPTLQGHELDLEALARLPEGSLGNAFARYFRDNGISPFVTTFAVESDLDYLGKRYRETHDLFHVITGYATDGVGEMELQAFMCGNLGIPSAALVLAFTTPSMAKSMAEQSGVQGVRGYFARLRAAYHRGRRSRELLSVPYEQLWDQPVASLSEQLCAPA